MWTISINSAINDGQNAHYDESCSSTLASTFSNGAKDPNTGVVSINEFCRDQREDYPKSSVVPSGVYSQGGTCHTENVFYRGKKCNCRGWQPLFFYLMENDLQEDKHVSFPSSNVFFLQATTDLYGKCTTTHSGTSAAAPEAAGVFALALEAK